MNTVISRDGTKIAYEKKGNGPAIILVAPAAADHKDAVPLSEHLANHFTVYNYDRRGRGESSDASQYTVQQEVEDIDVLIDEAGGDCILFGSSSGAVLALEAASQLGGKVTKLIMYEPPFIINDSRPRVPVDYVQNLNKLINGGKRSEAVEYFMIEALGIPSEYLSYMKAEPSWGGLEIMAHTLPYDGIIMGDTQSGNPLPTERWNVNIPTSIMTGENSESFVHDGAKALAVLLPLSEYNILLGLDHSAIMMAPDVVAKAIVEFHMNK